MSAAPIADRAIYYDVRGEDRHKYFGFFSGSFSIKFIDKLSLISFIYEYLSTALCWVQRMLHMLSCGRRTIRVRVPYCVRTHLNTPTYMHHTCAHTHPHTNNVQLFFPIHLFRLALWIEWFCFYLMESLFSQSKRINAPHTHTHSHNIARITIAANASRIYKWNANVKSCEMRKDWGWWGFVFFLI